MEIATADVSRMAHGVHANNRRHTSDAPDLIRLPLVAGPLRVARSILRYETAVPLQFIDITADVERVVGMSGIGEGWVTVFSRHTTAAIRINEHEPELLKDLSRVLAAFAPETQATSTTTSACGRSTWPRTSVRTDTLTASICS